jgi:protein gp37
MGSKTSIGWTDATANFWWGCEKVSPGCKHCYAEAMAERRGLQVFGSGTSRERVPSVWENLQKWDRAAKARGCRRRVFVNSMGDFFEDHPDAHAIRPRAWEAMRVAQRLDFQVLTKRPENIAGLLPTGFLEDPWPNIWLGTSIENDRYTSRADILRTIPAAVRFISAEPLLEPLPSLDLTGIHWLIAGGESGPAYRPMDHAWARDLRDRCVAAGVAYFFKQSAALRSETGTALVEVDGSVSVWRQYPLTPFDGEAVSVRAQHPGKHGQLSLGL